MLFKISSRFRPGDARYEKPFYISICDQHTSSMENRVAEYIAKRKGYHTTKCRVIYDHYSCRTVVDIFVNSEWVRWYAMYKLSPQKSTPKEQFTRIQFTASGASTLQFLND